MDENAITELVLVSRVLRRRNKEEKSRNCGGGGNSTKGQEWADGLDFPWDECPRLFSHFQHFVESAKAVDGEKLADREVLAELGVASGLIPEQYTVQVRHKPMDAGRIQAETYTQLKIQSIGDRGIALPVAMQFLWHRNWGYGRVWPGTLFSH